MRDKRGVVRDWGKGTSLHAGSQPKKHWQTDQETLATA